MLHSDQSTHSVVMCRPLKFGFNEQTGLDNEFQHKPNTEQADLSKRALFEFDHAVEKLQDAGVEVLTLEHPAELDVPDAVFPNNWFTTHADGTILLYPMKTPNRKQEVVPHRLAQLLNAAGYHVGAIESIDDVFDSKQILEGTGAIVFDHTNAHAFAALSERCEEKLFLDYCNRYDWIPNVFHAQSSHQQPVYHTNVLMSIGQHFAVICSESLSASDRKNVLKQLEDNQKEIIDISFEQMEQQFCANILELKSTSGEPVIALSKSAWEGFKPAQKSILASMGNCVVNDIITIEYIGGGSMRCMLAENFLPKVKA